ncbi:hypothetical protein KTO58_00440 [Chitinophaga pendula]|uniref:hypothetical protein n=1 Tax=Chitinophaga TaxID=79328 RepID=UPI0012FDD2BF|nr:MULTISPECIES: hypothetical protein [Chitinophaga]UCJ07678.1 hypothetical protein KTO58_00440 [Chitinophaga pendula]
MRLWINSTLLNLKMNLLTRRLAPNDNELSSQDTSNAPSPKYLCIITITHQNLQQ